MSKKTIYVLLICAAVLILSAVAIFFMVKHEKEKFKNEGVKVSAAILYKFVKEVRTTTNKGRTKISYDKIFTIYFSPKHEADIEKDTIGNYKLSGTELVDKIFDKIGFKKISFVQKDIIVSDEEYNTNAVGGKIDVYYLKADSTEVRTARYVESSMF